MAEYIEREAALAMKYNSAQFDSRTGTWSLPVVDVYDILDVPAADVRPVVFCRGCKYAPIGDKDGDDLKWPHNEYDGNPCPHKCSDNWYSHKPAPDFFCAAGEKKEE